MQDRDARLPRSDGVGQLPRSVGGSIVDNQHVGLRKSLEDRAEDALQVLDLVEGGQHHPHAATGSEPNAGHILGWLGLRGVLAGWVLGPVAQRPIPT